MGQKYEDDDGETIVNMNVDGMPWYDPRADEAGGLNRTGAGAGKAGEADRGRAAKEPEPLTKEQMRLYRWAALKAGLLIALVFGAAYALFIAFCYFVWLK